MDIQKLIDEVVAKLRELYAVLTVQQGKVGKAIESLTGEHFEIPGTMTPAEVTELKKELAELKTKLSQVGQ